MDWGSILSILGAAISGGGIYKIIDIILNRKKVLWINILCEYERFFNDLFTLFLFQTKRRTKVNV